MQLAGESSPAPSLFPLSANFGTPMRPPPRVIFASDFSRSSKDTAIRATAGSEGGRTFDQFATEAALAGDIKLWHAVLMNVRSGIMPPAGEDRLTPAEFGKSLRGLKPTCLRLTRPTPIRVASRCCV
jgi:hypothetical protein